MWYYHIHQKYIYNEANNAQLRFTKVNFYFDLIYEMKLDGHSVEHITSDKGVPTARGE